MKWLKVISIGVVLVILCAGFCLFQEINTDDETWFLQVVNRVISGEVLYRDVYLGVTPLSVYFSQFFCRIFGCELLVNRGLLGLYFIASGLMACGILKELKVSNPFSIVFLLAFFVFTHQQSTWGFSGYNALAKVFFLGACYFALRWVNRITSFNSLGIAACFAALCFCSKQNVGVLALFCLFFTLIMIGRIKTFRLLQSLKGLAILGGAFCLTTTLCLVPIFFQGSSSHFWDYAFWNKKRYLATQHLTYFLTPENWDSYSLFIFTGPALLVLLCLFTYFHLKKKQEIKWSVFFIFLIGSVCSLYPRPDNPHKLLCIPFALIAIRYCYDHFKSYQFTGLKISLGICFSALIVISFNKPAAEWSCDEKRACRIPHFYGIVMDKQCDKHWKSMKKNFASLNLRDHCFFLSTHGGFYYLLFDLKNPTPFDYPIHTALGCQGEEEIQQKIQSFEIDHVIIDHEKWSNWMTVPSDRRPYQLEAFLHDKMQLKDVEHQGVFKGVFQSFERRNLE